MADLKTEPSARQILMADILLVMVAFIWGAGIPMSALLARSITPLWAVALRMLLSAFFLALMFPKNNNLDQKDWAISSILTAVLTGVFITLTFGLVYSTASNSPSSADSMLSSCRSLSGRSIRRDQASDICRGRSNDGGGSCHGVHSGMEFNFGDFLSFIMAVFYALQVRRRIRSKKGRTSPSRSPSHNYACRGHDSDSHDF